MAWTDQKWINFRDTAGYVVDDAGQVVLAYNPDTGLPGYPTSLTVNGDTFNAGWTTGAGSDGERNRTTTADKRLAGIHFAPNSSGSPRILKVELLGGTGQYEIRLASGDPSGVGTSQPYIQIKDGTTLVATIDGTSGRANHMDATGTNYTAANWPGSNSAITLTFNDTSGTGGTPIMYIEMGNTATAGFTMINTLGIKYLGAGAATSLIAARRFPRSVLMQ